MSMNQRDDLRRALRLAAQSMSRTISAVREQGHHELADELKLEFDRWVRVANRGVSRVSPRGRQVVAPMREVLFYERPAGKPPVGVREWEEHVSKLRAQYAVRDRPPLRVVPLRPLVKAGSRDEVLDAG